MNNKHINEDYIDIVSKNKEACYRDFLKVTDQVANSSAIYKGEPIPFLYHPLFITVDDMESFEKLTKDLMVILNKVINKYVESPKYREKFGFSKELEELILIDPGYAYNVPMGRFDVFYDDSFNFKFCELNADGSSAMNETNVLERFFLESQGIKELKKKYDVDYKELVYKWIDESITIYESWQGNEKHEKPNVAIVDFEGGKTVNEFQEFKKAYIERGYNAEIVDPRRIEYRDGKPYHNDMRIDLIYRRLVTSDLMRRYTEVPEFIEAYKNKAACFIGPIRSQIVHNKIIFKVLHDEETLEILTDEEKEFVKNHIPFTGILSRDKDIYEEILNNKNKYVLKPTDLYASMGVYVGADITIDEWKRVLDDCLDKEYLIQEFVKPYTEKMVHFDEAGNLSVDDFKHIIGLYMYGEKFAGIYTRVNTENIISSLYGCWTVPNLFINKKK